MNARVDQETLSESGGVDSLLTQVADGIRMKPLEMALVFGRLASQGMTPQEIAAMFPGRISIKRVQQLLMLAGGGAQVHSLVASGDVPADVAIEAVRVHGDEAGPYLNEQLVKARSLGKRALTFSVIRGPQASPRAIASFVSEVRGALTSMPASTVRALGRVTKSSQEDMFGQKVTVDAAFLLRIIKAHDELLEEEQRAADRYEARRFIGSQDAIQFDEPDSAS